jgi:hypothetical protein
MAIINHDPYTTRQNITIVGSYLTFGKSNINICKKNGMDDMSNIYTLCAIMRIYKDYDSYIGNFYPISEFLVDVSTNEPTDDFYNLLYDKVKLTFTYTTDI